MTEYFLVREITDEFLRDYTEALKAYAPQSCEYAYPNLYAWQDSYDTKMARLPDGSFSVVFNVDGEFVFMPLVGENCNIEMFLHEVSDYCKHFGKNGFYLGGFLKEEAEKVESVLEKRIFAPERGNFDYIYEVTPLETFSGKKLHAKRNHLNRFLKLYDGRYEIKPLTKELCEECKEFTKYWNEINAEYASEGLEEEAVSTNILLDNLERFSLSGLCLYVDGKIVGFTLGEESYPGSDTLVVHIEKGLYDIQGVYPMLFSSYLKSLGGKFRYVNREDDVDDEGLRKSKLSYNPCHFVEKYLAKVSVKTVEKV